MVVRYFLNPHLNNVSPNFYHTSPVSPYFLLLASTQSSTPLFKPHFPYNLSHLFSLTPSPNTAN